MISQKDIQDHAVLSRHLQLASLQRAFPAFSTTAVGTWTSVWWESFYIPGSRQFFIALPELSFQHSVANGEFGVELLCYYTADRSGARFASFLYDGLIAPPIAGKEYPILGATGFKTDLDSLTTGAHALELLVVNRTAGTLSMNVRGYDFLEAFLLGY